MPRPFHPKRDIAAQNAGDKRLYRFAPVASDVPERSVVRVDPAAPATGAAWPASRLLPTPEPIETVALLPDHPPVSFTWRGVSAAALNALTAPNACSANGGSATPR
jgi:hypothetical protein